MEVTVKFDMQKMLRKVEKIRDFVIQIESGIEELEKVDFEMKNLFKILDKIDQVEHIKMNADEIKTEINRIKNFHKFYTKLAEKES